MVEFKDARIGGREMTAEITDFHIDLKDKECPRTNRLARSNQLHFVLKPSEPAGWKNQNWWIYDSFATGSRLYDVIKQFVKIGILTDDEVANASDSSELGQLIMKNCDGKNIKFSERRFGRGIKENWFPEAIV